MKHTLPPQTTDTSPALPTAEPPPFEWSPIQQTTPPTAHPPTPLVTTLPPALSAPVETVLTPQKLAPARPDREVSIRWLEQWAELVETLILGASHRSPEFIEQSSKDLCIKKLEDGNEDFIDDFSVPNFCHLYTALRDHWKQWNPSLGPFVPMTQQQLNAALQAQLEATGVGISEMARADVWAELMTASKIAAANHISELAAHFPQWLKNRRVQMALMGAEDPRQQERVKRELNAALMIGQDWPDPQPLPPEHPPVNPFDYDLLPPAFVPFARDICEQMQCPSDYVAVSLMVCAGAVIGKKFGIRPKRHDYIWVAFSNFWGALVGPPSVMKSPAMNAAMYSLKRMAAEDKAAYDGALSDYQAEAMVREAEKKEQGRRISKALAEGDRAQAKANAKACVDASKKEPKMKRRIVQDATMEKLAELMNENGTDHGCLLQYRDELIGWLRNMDKDGHENDRAFALECFDGNGSMSQDRIGRGSTFVDHSIFSVLGGIQPAVIERYVREAIDGGGGDGLIARFCLLVWPDFDHSKPWKNVDRPSDRNAKEEVMKVFRDLDALTAQSVGATAPYEGEPLALKFSEEAQNCFDRAREVFENDCLKYADNPALQAHLTKYRKLIPALALVIHCCDQKTGPVGLEPVQKAFRWADYLKSHATKLYGATTGAAHSARLLSKKILSKKLVTEFTLRQLRRHNWQGLEKDAADAAVAMLIELGWLRETIEKTGGRPAEKFEINAKVFQLPKAR